MNPNITVPSQRKGKSYDVTALARYSRLCFITNLLPLLQLATSLRRIVDVAGGGHEGSLDAADFQALHVPFSGIRGHLTSLITLSLEAVARTAPDVSFVHNYPRIVDTKLSSCAEGMQGSF